MYDVAILPANSGVVCRRKIKRMKIMASALRSYKRVCMGEDPCSGVQGQSP